MSDMVKNVIYDWRIERQSNFITLFAYLLTYGKHKLVLFVPEYALNPLYFTAYFFQKVPKGI